MNPKQEQYVEKSQALDHASVDIGAFSHASGEQVVGVDFRRTALLRPRTITVEPALRVPSLT